MKSGTCSRGWVAAEESGLLRLLICKRNSVISSYLDVRACPMDARPVLAHDQSGSSIEDDGDLLFITFLFCVLYEWAYVARECPQVFRLSCKHIELLNHIAAHYCFFTYI